MKTLIAILSALFFTSVSQAKIKGLKVSSVGEFFRVEPSAKNGFHHPFFLYIPKDQERVRNLLVVPNNTGDSQQDYVAQIRVTKRQAMIDASLAERTKSILLVPAFPRPKVDPPIYTHALSKSTLLVRDGPLYRIDLQLIKMIEVAKDLLEQIHKIKLRRKILLSGFSASASFVNRFSFLHPELVAAAAVGAPGGWPIAPMGSHDGKPLRYPVGIQDVADLAGAQVDLKLLKKVQFFFYIGEKDENDSVTFRDSFSTDDEKLIFEFFGKKPVERWPHSEALYKKTDLRAVFKIYPGVAHETPFNVREDVISFFNGVSVDE